MFFEFKFYSLGSTFLLFVIFFFFKNLLLMTLNESKLDRNQAGQKEFAELTPDFDSFLN
jgi:hypothetical protein